MSKAFFDTIRPLFGGSLTHAQVSGCELLLAATAQLDTEYRAYILATAYHETAHTMQPVRETLASSDTQAVARLESAWNKGKLPWVSRPYWRFDGEGKTWLGRGYVQLTHKANYARAGEELGVDLVGNPSAAMNPDLAAQILVRGCMGGWFTGQRLSDYLPGDYKGARRVVNGTDRAAEIARYASKFEAALLAMPAAPQAPASGIGLLAALAAFFVKWIGK